MTAKEKGPASAPPPAEPSEPIDVATLGQLTRSQLVTLLWHGLGGLFSESEEPPAVKAIRALVRQANDAAGHAWVLEDCAATPEQEADLAERWAQADRTKALALQAIEQLLPSDCAALQ